MKKTSDCIGAQCRRSARGVLGRRSAARRKGYRSQTCGLRIAASGSLLAPIRFLARRRVDGFWQRAESSVARGALFENGGGDRLCQALAVFGLRDEFRLARVAQV